MFSAILFLALAASSPAQQSSLASHFDGNSWWSHVKFLADDSLEGRDTGSEGLRKAQSYAVDQLQKAGLPAQMASIKPSVSINTKSTKVNPLSPSSPTARQNRSPSPTMLSSVRVPHAIPPRSTRLWFSSATA
jgi:hypothetical protein